jgi:hypothetical protein
MIFTQHQLTLKAANIVFDGNSWTEWEDSTAVGKWPSRLKNIAPYNTVTCTFTNTAKSGRSTTLLDADASLRVDSLYVKGRLNICCIWEIGNDLPGRTPVQVYASLQRYCRNRQLAGWYVVVFGLQALRFTAGITTQQDIDNARSYVNSRLPWDHKRFADAYVDPSAVTRLNTASVADCPDGAHHTSAVLDGLLPLVNVALNQIVIR